MIEKYAPLYTTREEAILELIDRAEWEAAWKALSEIDIPEIDIFPEFGRK